MRIIISGGGTAGHIYPAIATADKLKEKYGADILFVGASSRMEMDKVPKAGYEIIGLPVEGLKRKITHKNLIVLAKFLRSSFIAKRIVKKWKPDAVVGFGGYASAPVIRAAKKYGIPIILQEQNSYAGIANKMHAKYAKVVCTAYDNMGSFFPRTKIIKTGNPLRVNYEDLKSNQKRTEAYKYFNLDCNRKTVLVVGGSLGAGTINKAMEVLIEKHESLECPMQILWQTGTYYWEKELEFYNSHPVDDILIKPVPFIDRMDYAYSIADIMVCRAGASTISEIQLIGTPAIFVPSPNVAEDHQTHNAMALVNNNAAEMIPDSEIAGSLLSKINSLVNDDVRLQELSRNARQMGIPDSAEQVADIVVSYIIKDDE